MIVQLKSGRIYDIAAGANLRGQPITQVAVTYEDTIDPRFAEWFRDEVIPCLVPEDDPK